MLWVVAVAAATACSPTRRTAEAAAVSKANAVAGGEPDAGSHPPRAALPAGFDRLGAICTETAAVQFQSAAGVATCNRRGIIAAIEYRVADVVGAPDEPLWAERTEGGERQVTQLVRVTASAVWLRLIRETRRVTGNTVMLLPGEVDDDALAAMQLRAGLPAAPLLRDTLAWKNAIVERGPMPASPDHGAIEALVTHLQSTHGLWVNGVQPQIDLPEQTPAAQIVARALRGYDGIGMPHVLEVRAVHVDEESPMRSAALVDTALGRRIVLFGYAGARDGWSTKVFAAHDPDGKW